MDPGGYGGLFSGEVARGSTECQGLTSPALERLLSFFACVCWRVSDFWVHTARCGVLCKENSQNQVVHQFGAVWGPALFCESGASKKSVSLFTTDVLWVKALGNCKKQSRKDCRSEGFMCQFETAKTVNF